MLIPVKDLQTVFNVNPQSILHVGAHLAEEAPAYIGANWGTSGIFWLEVQPDLVAKLKKELDPEKHVVIEAAVWSQSGIKMQFNRMTNSQSSSLLDLGQHAKYYPEIELQEKVEITTKRIDEIFENHKHFNFVNLDLQGAELEALKGMGQLLEKVSWIYSEVNWKELYKGCAIISEVDDFLGKNGFLRVATFREPFVGWGDALYIRIEEFNKLNKIVVFKWRIESFFQKQLRLLRRLISKTFRFVTQSK
jgi:FkbM family methyltransferase